MPDLRISGHVRSVKVLAARVGELHQHAGEGRPDAEAFLDAGLEIWEALGLVIGHGAGDGAGADGRVDFGAES